jgi:hypothetical protein
MFISRSGTPFVSFSLKIPAWLMSAVVACASLPVYSGDLSVSELKHSAECPISENGPCIMNRPFNVMQYTLLTKNVGINELNGLWAVTFGVDIIKKSTVPFQIRMVDIYGNAHMVEVTFSQTKGAGADLKSSSQKPSKSAEKSSANGRVNPADTSLEASPSDKARDDSFIGFKP